MSDLYLQQNDTLFYSLTITKLYWYFELDRERKNTGEWFKESRVMVNPKILFQ